MSLVEKVRDAGVVGAGGAGFPTHVKINSEADFILMNGAECEPLLRVDQQLMAMHPDEVINGFKLAGEAVKAKQAIIGVKGKHAELIELLRERIKSLGIDSYVSVGILPDIYPAGDEHVLVHELTGRIVPEMGIPLNAGCVVVNSESCYNIYRAQEGLPVTETYVTIAGDVPERKTLKVPVGTAIADLVKASGISDPSEYRVIGGGPMMGPLLADINGYITKRDKGLIVLKKDHPLIRKKACTKDQARRINRSACEQCRMCTDLCPRFLLGHSMQPHKMMRTLSYFPNNPELQTIASLCSQCGLCEYFSCPANLHPKMTNMILKDNLVKAGIKYQPEKTEYEVRNARKYRLVPSKRLVARLGLKNFDKPAPYTEDFLMPSEVHIALSQHVGAPAEAIVNVGDRVEVGQMIARIPEGKLGAPVHASISGIVTECDSTYIVVRKG